MKFKVFFNAKNELVARLSRTVFRISLVTLIFIFVLETFLPGFVTNYFNPIWILILALIASIMSPRYN